VILPPTLEELRAIAQANALELSDEELLQRLEAGAPYRSRNRWQMLLGFFPELNTGSANRPDPAQ
jgi:hypothetical protein